MKMSKKDIIREKIIQLINSNELKNGKLPGERELAVMLDAGRNTVRSALQELAADGKIERFRKKGTIIKNSTEPQPPKIAGLIMRTSGHLYYELYNHLYNEFANAGYSIQTVKADMVIAAIKPPRSRLIHAVQNLLNSNPDVIVISGVASYRFPYYSEIYKRHPVLLNFYDSNIKGDFTGVWIDYRHAGYLAGKYLIEKKCKRPIFFSNFIPHGARLNSEAYAHHKDKLMIDGFRQAMLEGGIDPETAIFSSQNNSIEQHFEILANIASQKKYLPDGFCGAADNIVIYFMRDLMENYRKIPENITFVGIGNTPWSRNPSVIPFSSVDLNSSEIAKAVVQQAQLPFEDRKDIYIKPKIVKRERNNC